MSDTADDADVPPAVICSRCGRADCAGCDSSLRGQTESAILAWEDRPGSLHRRLWDTALASSIDPMRTFGQLPEGRVSRALGFAFLAEAIAIGSLGGAALLSMLALAPGVVARVLGDARVLGAAGSLLIVAVVGMVALHALWGMCLELGARERGAVLGWRQGMRFGLYACGWDLLTSPAGVLQGIGARGFVGAWAPIIAAARVPRVAMHAYLERCRHFPMRAQRRGVHLSLAVLGSLLLLILAGAAVLTLGFLRHMLG